MSQILFNLVYLSFVSFDWISDQWFGQKIIVQITDRHYWKWCDTGFIYR